MPIAQVNVVCLISWVHGPIMRQTSATRKPLISRTKNFVASLTFCATYDQETVPQGHGLRRPDPWQRWLHTSAADHVRSHSALRHGVCHHA
jgi:hypothetical protein